MLKKISVIIAILFGLAVIVGCSSTEVTTDVPEPTQQKSKKPTLFTYVPKGMSAENYLKKYYTLYTKGNLKEAYRMLPSSKKETQTVEQYEETHKSMPTEGFTLGTKQEQGKNTVIDVKLKLKKYGTWTVSWQFEKTAKGLAVADYAASGSSGGK